MRTVLRQCVSFKFNWICFGYFHIQKENAWPYLSNKHFLLFLSNADASLILIGLRMEDIVGLGFTGSFQCSLFKSPVPLGLRSSECQPFL